MFLQEVQRLQARRVARALSARTLAWRLKHWALPHRAEGLAVLGVTRSVRAVGAVALTARWRVWSWRRRILQLARLGDVTLANIHLTPHGDAEARGREVATILDRLDPGSRIVAGDFNATPEASLLVDLAVVDLRDAWVVARGAAAATGVDAATGTDATDGSTNWSSLPRTGPPDQRLDYIWVSPELDVTGARLPRFGDDGFDRFPHLSDHLPLTVELDLPD